MISLYVVEVEVVRERSRLMLTIPSPPFGSSWHSLARFPIFPFHTNGQRHERDGGSSGRIQITFPMPASSFPLGLLPALPRLGSTFRASDRV